MSTIIISFAGPDNMTLHGWISSPAGKGPFPVMVFNHASNRHTKFHQELAHFYNSKGFIFFMPVRHGHSISSESGGKKLTWIGDAEGKCKELHPVQPFTERCHVHLHEKYNKDVTAAIEWLKSSKPRDEHQIEVLTNRIVMSGVSYGGTQTLLSAENGLGIKAFIPFAPAAMSWGNKELQTRLTTAVLKAPEPIFLLQAHNDFNLGPSNLFGPLLEVKNLTDHLSQSRIYSSFGETTKDADGKITATDGHSAFAAHTGGMAIWGQDVMDYINRAIR